jgi:diadenosine tetraphosphate (Ap4A) HIT family hydrolase
VTFYCFENARTPDQVAEMRRLDAAGICLFCPDGLARHPPERIVLRTWHWTVLRNDFPYRGTRLHLLLVPRQHATDLTGLHADSQRDFWRVLAAVVRDHQLTYYGLGVRNGDCRYTGASIEHVHAHLLVGDPDPASAGPVRMRFSARPARPPQPG